MITTIQRTEPNGCLHPQINQYWSEGKLPAARNLSGPFIWVPLLAGLLCLLFSPPSARAQGIPPGCVGSAIGISLFTSSSDVHIGDTLTYSASVFNGRAGDPLSCDASNITASITTPDGVVHPITLIRTYLSHAQSDFYTNVVSYVARAQDVRPDGTLRTTADVAAIIYQNDTPSAGGAQQGVNTEVSQPCIKIAVQCVGGVGENGVITYTGTVTNCGNNRLVGVTITNFVNGGQFQVAFITNLLRGEVAPFSGSWIPLDPCSPRTATFVATGIDQFTAIPRTVTSSADATCQNTLTPGIKVTQVCPAQPTAPGQLLTFSGSVSNTGNVTLTNVVVVGSQPAPNSPVFTQASLAPGEVVAFTGSYVAPTNCSVTSTLNATAFSRCGPPVGDAATVTCPILTTPQIALTVLCPATPPAAGGTLTYSGTVFNGGDITLTDIVVVSDRPAPNTSVFTIPSLAPGASASFTTSVSVPADACSITTTFNAQGKDQCTLNSVTSSAETTCPTTTASGIAVTLVCPTASAAAGGPITFTGTVRNSGNVTLNNVVVSNDKTVPNTVLTVPSLAPGASTNFSATFTAPADTCSVSSTVTATGSDACSSVGATATASATCQLTTSPGIVVTQVCPGNPAIPGGLLTYSGTVRNSGNVTLTNVVVVNNLSGTTPIFTTPTLVPGQELSFTGSYVASTNCSSTSTSTATGQSICGVAVNNSASATCPILTAPGIAVTAVCPETPIVPGSLLTYSGTVRNTGNIILTNVVVISDRPVPNTQVFAAAFIMPGASAPYTASFTVPATDCSVTTTVAATGQDTCTGTPTQNSAVITCSVATAPSIALTLACPTSPATVGGSITYSGTVKNTGNVILNNVVVVNDQPAPGTPVTGPISLEPGASANFTTTFTAPVDACSVSSTVSASGTDACAATVVTDTESATCTLVTAPGIAITQNCPGGAVSPSGIITYSGSVRNSGNITLTNVVVTKSGSGVPPTNVVDNIVWVNDAVPAGATKFTTGSDTWTWITSNPTPFLGLKAQQSDIETKTHTHGFKDATDTFHINVGDILVVYVYLDPAHPTSEVMVEWSDGSFEHRAYWGDNLITFGTDGTDSRRHMGPLPAMGTWVRLEVPASLVGLEGSTLTGMSFDLYGGRAYWDAAGKANLGNPVTEIEDTVFTVATLAPGASADFSVEYVVPGNSGCSFTSTLTASGANKCTGSRVNDQVSTTCNLATAPAISVTQSCPTTLVGQGEVLNYSGVVHNSGNITLTNVVVMNNRPAENTVIFTVASLAPGASANFTGSYTVPINCCDVWSTVTATGKDTCTGVAVTDTATATCMVKTVPKIAVTKVCPDKAVSPGGILQYSGIVSNAGNITLVDVTIVNTQPIAESPVFGPITLAPGEAVAYDASYLVSPDFCGTDTVTARGFDSCTLEPVVNSVTTVCPVITAPRISITKHCPLETTPRGGVFTFSGTVMNSGNVTLTDVMVVNNYQTDCYSRTNGPVIGPITLLPGAAVDFSGSYTAPMSCCEVVDTLTASGADSCSGSRVSSTASQVCPLLTTPGITVTRVCPASPVPVGGLFTFTGVVSNNGDVNLTNVTVVSSQPNANTPLLGPIELAPGETKQFSGSYTVTADSNPATDTVTAQGYDLCQGRTTTASADCTGPVGPLVISSVALANGTARITWTAKVGAVYRVQCTTSSDDTNWTTVLGDVTATGTTASKDDAVGSVKQRFYRVMVVRW